MSETEHQSSELLYKDFQPDKVFKENHRSRFNVVLKAFQVLGLSEDEIKTILHLIAACLHLDAAGSVKCKFETLVPNNHMIALDC